MTDPAGLDGEGRLQALDLEPIKERTKAYFDGGWSYYPPHESGWSDYVEVARQFYAEAANDIPALIVEVERLRAERDEWIARFNKLPEIVAHAEERGELHASRLSVPAAPPRSEQFQRVLQEMEGAAGQYGLGETLAVALHSWVHQLESLAVVPAAPPPQEQK